MRTGLGWAPEIPDHWSVVPLNYVAKMGTGHTPDRNKAEYWENCTIPWVTTPDVTRRPDSLEPLMDTEQKISEVGMTNSAAVLHPTQTVMLSRTASVGYSARIGRPMATTQAFVTWEAGPRLDPRYLLMVLRAMKPEWERLAYGSTHLTIYMPDLESLRIPLPPIEEQRQIADLIDAESARIDSIIEARQSYLKLLAERDAIVLTECFSAANGESNPHPVLGEVPSGWTVMSLRRAVRRVDVGVVVNPSSYFVGEGVPFVHGFNVRTGRIDLTGVKYMSEASNRRLARSQVREGDVLVVRVGAPGRAAVVPKDLDRANCASVLILRRSDVVNPHFLEAFLNSPVGNGQVRVAQYGAAQEVISAGQMSSFVIAVPSLEEQCRRVRRLHAQRESANCERVLVSRQVALLVERRQAMILATVSGQVALSAQFRSAGSTPGVPA